MDVWKHFIHDAKTLEDLGEIDSIERPKYSKKANNLATLTFDLPYARDTIADELRRRRCMIASYRFNPEAEGGDDYELRFVGPARTKGLRVAGTARLGVMAQSAGVRSRHLIINDYDTVPNATNGQPKGRLGSGKEATGISFPEMTRGQAAHALVQHLRRLHGDIWLDSRLEDQLATSRAAVDRWGGMKKLSEGIDLLSDGASGMDYEWVPCLEATPSGPVYARLKTWDMQGVDRSQGEDAVIFEYDMGLKNVVSYEIKEDETTMANSVYDVQSDGRPYALHSSDPVSIRENGVWEDVINAQFPDTKNRQEELDLHSAVRGWPRMTVEFQPVASHLVGIDPTFTGWIPGVHFDVGDRVLLRSFLDGEIDLNHSLRVWGYELDLSGGKEVATLGLYQE